MGTALADPYDPAVTAVFARLIVPELVIGPPLNPVPVAIDVTVPVPDTEIHEGLDPAPFVLNTYPEVLGAKAVHCEPLRYKIEPCVLLIAASM